MLPILRTARVKLPDGREVTTNIVLDHSGRPCVRYADGYYFLAKDGYKLTKTRSKAI